VKEPFNINIPCFDYCKRPLNYRPCYLLGLRTGHRRLYKAYKYTTCRPQPRAAGGEGNWVCVLCSGLFIREETTRRVI